MPRALGGAFLAGLILVVGTACGTGGLASGGNASNGKKLFVSKDVYNPQGCGSCHALADAGTSVQIGPNLDDAFEAAKANGFKESTIRNVVLDQIRYPTKGSGMPANLVHGQDADDVAAYVASVVGKKAKPIPAGATGKDLFSSLGCQSCHSLDGSKSVGPTFKGLFGLKVKLANGQTVTADQKYLIESIVDPDKQIVMGYSPGVMSGTIPKGKVSEAEAKKLVDFIKKQK